MGRSVRSNVEERGMRDRPRKPTRQAGYDYSLPGSYFVTICTKDRHCILGAVQDDRIVLSEIGKAVELQWLAIPRHFPSARVEDYVIMPNHLYGILLLYPLNSLPDCDLEIRFSEAVGAGQALPFSGDRNPVSRATRPVIRPVTLFHVARAGERFGSGVFTTAFWEITKPIWKPAGISPTTRRSGPRIGNSFPAVESQRVKGRVARDKSRLRLRAGRAGIFDGQAEWAAALDPPLPLSK